MSDLNLVPNPIVIGIQSAIFLASIFVVKKLFVSPYLTLREKRTQMTSGQAEESKEAYGQVSRIKMEIENRRIESNKQIFEESEKLLALAKIESDQQIKKVDEQLSVITEERRKNLEINLTEERKLIVSDAKNLALSVTQQLLG